MTPDLADLARATVAGCCHAKAWDGGENAADEEGACAPCIEAALTTLAEENAKLRKELAHVQSVLEFVRHAYEG